MNKTKTLIVRVTEKQEQLLENQARENGFMNKSEYVRFALFKKVPIISKVVNYE
jgi:Arc/MetJ-type ribon-helix-helix transcriptional regulator